jgi:hypothetical protein
VTNYAVSIAKGAGGAIYVGTLNGKIVSYKGGLWTEVNFAQETVVGSIGTVSYDTVWERIIIPDISRNTTYAISEEDLSQSNALNAHFTHYAIYDSTT